MTNQRLAMTATRELRLDVGKPVTLDDIDPREMPVGPQSKRDGAAVLEQIRVDFKKLQEALWAEGRAAGEQDGRRVLVVLQGMDTSGKGGVVRNVGGLLNPQWLRVAGFATPTAAERRHHFLWRIRKQLPGAGMIGFFDRSHYEDVLVPRVQKTISESVAQERITEINAFEQELAESGVRLLKCYLHVSPEHQRERLLARLDRPAKRWKYNPADLVVRSQWSQYQQFYEEALQQCASDVSPWHLVPGDRKWYRNWAVAQLLLDALQDLAPQLPPPAFDVDTERAALLKDDPLTRAARR